MADFDKLDFLVEISKDILGFVVGMMFWGFLLGGGAWIAFRLFSNFL